MNRKTIKKTIKINAGSEKVFEVLTNDRLTRLWYMRHSAKEHMQKPTGKREAKQYSKTTVALA